MTKKTSKKAGKKTSKKAGKKGAKKVTKKAGKKAPAKLPRKAPGGEDIHHLYTAEPPPKGADKIQGWVKAYNTALGGSGRIYTGADVKAIEFIHLPTGLPALCYVTNGGLIKGRVTQFWGPEGCCKTTTLAQVFGDLQRRGKHVALCSIEPFDKNWWRHNGVFIPYVDEEIRLFSEAEQHRAILYNQVHKEWGYGTFTLMEHHIGENALSMVVDATEANIFGAIGVDSLGAVSAKDILDRPFLKTDKHGGNSALFSKLSRHLQARLNLKFDAEGKISGVGDHQNETCLVLVNQVRTNMDASEHAKAEWELLKATGGHALLHLWSQSVFFHSVAPDKTERGSLLSEIRQGERKITTPEAVVFKLVGTKMRGGTKMRQATMTLNITETQRDGLIWRPGTMDSQVQLRKIAVSLGVINKIGTTGYSHGDLQWRGKGNVDLAMINDPELYEKVYRDMVGAARRQAATGSVPDIGVI